MRQPGVEIEDLSFRYPEYPGMQARDLLRHASLAVEPGSLAAVLGETDSGKTTLARILGALVPRFTGGALSGRASIDGMELTRARPFELVERVGLVFQNPDEQLITTRCDTEVAFALESLGLPRDEILRLVSSALGLMGLTDFASRNPASLSGGEKKRLLLACLAAIDPEVWVLDEAFEELDVIWRSAVLAELASRGRTAIVLDSRWTSLLAGAAGSFALLADGTMRPRGRGELHRFLGELAAAGITPASAVPAPHKAGSGSRLLAVQDLGFSFPDSRFSLSVDGLELRRGEVCALLGPNGSGKSTLARLLCGLLAPARGRVVLDSPAGPRRAAADELNRTVGYLFQNPDHQIFLPTVREELEVGLRARGLRGPEAGRLVEEAIERFGLPGPEMPPALMSYGSRKQLQAAICWLLERDLVILDEADSGLSWRQFLALVEALRGRDTGIVLITHDETLARHLADRVLLMEKGTVSEEPAGGASGGQGA